jgi:UDP-N-acetylglucosamine 2-epimerase
MKGLVVSASLGLDHRTQEGAARFFPGLQIQQLVNENRSYDLKTIHLIAAARPNFMKIAPLYHALRKTDWAAPVIVHTGQHYDLNMSESFFKDLMLPAPQHHMGVGSGSHTEQTGRVMIAYEKLLLEKRPGLVVVVGDVNSTVACTLAAVKLGVKTAHLEAFGLYGQLAAAPGMHLDGPVSYIPFMNLLFNCRLAITDSGGIQEETTYLGISCLTLRPNTERRITVTEGTNRLCTPEDIENQAAAAMQKNIAAEAPSLWDGQTASRVVASARHFVFAGQLRK